MRQNATTETARLKPGMLCLRSLLILVIGCAFFLLPPLLSYRRVRVRSSTQKAADSYRLQLAVMSPALHRLNACKGALEHNRRTLNALENWKKERPHLAQPLRLIALETPDFIQLRRLNYISSPDKLPTGPHTPWDQSFDLQGLIQHPEAELMIIRYRQNLIRADAVRRLTPTLRLLSFTRPEDAAAAQTNTTEPISFLLSGNNFETKHTPAP